MNLMDDVVDTINIKGAVEADRPQIKAKIFREIKKALKQKLGVDIDVNDIDAYLGDNCVDELATLIIDRDKVDESTRRIKTHRRFIRENKLGDLADSAMDKMDGALAVATEAMCDLSDRLLNGIDDATEFIADKACKIFFPKNIINVRKGMVN